MGLSEKAVFVGALSASIAGCVRPSDPRVPQELTRERAPIVIKVAPAAPTMMMDFSRHLSRSSRSDALPSDDHTPTPSLTPTPTLTPHPSSTPTPPPPPIRGDVLNPPSTENLTLTQGEIPPPILALTSKICRIQMFNPNDPSVLEAEGSGFAHNPTQLTTAAHIGRRRTKNGIETALVNEQGRVPFRVRATCGNGVIANLTEGPSDLNIDVAYWLSDVELPQVESTTSYKGLKKGDPLYSIYFPEGGSSPIIAQGAYLGGVAGSFTVALPSRGSLRGFSGGFVALPSGSIIGMGYQGDVYDSTRYPTMHWYEDIFASIGPNPSIGLVRAIESTIQ